MNSIWRIIMRALLFCSFLLTGCSALLEKLAPEEEEEEEEEADERSEGERMGDCYDGEDNDGDGYIDCDDQGCDDKPACNDTGWTQPDSGEDTWDTGGDDTEDTEDDDTEDTEDIIEREPVQTSLQGNSYRIELSNGTFTQPAGFGSLMSGFFEFDFLIGIISDNNGQIRARGAISEPGSTNQDLCTETEEGFSTGSFSSNPYFAFPPFDAALFIAGTALFFEDLQISGVFAPDGSSFEEGVISGKLDARENYGFLEAMGLSDSSPEDFCDLIAGFGVSCEACADGVDYCMPFEIEDIYAPKQSGVIVAVTSSDISNNSQCD